MKTLTFYQALHIVAFLVIALIAKVTKAQVPDTLYYEPFTFIDAETSGTSDSQQYLILSGIILAELDRSGNPFPGRFMTDSKFSIFSSPKH